MLTVAAVATLIVAPAGMFVGALVERRRARATWRAATDQACALTRDMAHERADQWARAAHALDLTTHHRSEETR